MTDLAIIIAPPIIYLAGVLHGAWAANNRRDEYEMGYQPRANGLPSTPPQGGSGTARYPERIPRFHVSDLPIHTEK